MQRPGFNELVEEIRARRGHEVATIGDLIEAHMKIDQKISLQRMLRRRRRRQGRI